VTALLGRRTVRIRNRLGLHARAAARFVQTANRFRARITVVRDGRAMDGKSILGMLLLAASEGTVLELRAEGEDAEAALDALAALVDGGLGEEV
jgi:phosphocarrier protein HPr